MAYDICGYSTTEERETRGLIILQSRGLQMDQSLLETIGWLFSGKFCVEVSRSKGCKIKRFASGFWDKGGFSWTIMTVNTRDMGECVSYIILLAYSTVKELAAFQYAWHKHWHGTMQYVFAWCIDLVKRGRKIKERVGRKKDTMNKKK